MVSADVAQSMSPLVLKPGAEVADQHEPEGWPVIPVTPPQRTRFRPGADVGLRLAGACSTVKAVVHAGRRRVDAATT